MNAGELIEILKTFPPETRVVVDGFEGGFDDPTPQVVVMVPGEPAPYCGAHDVVYPDLVGRVDADTVAALCLSREGPDVAAVVWPSLAEAEAWLLAHGEE